VSMLLGEVLDTRKYAHPLSKGKTREDELVHDCQGMLMQVLKRYCCHCLCMLEVKQQAIMPCYQSCDDGANKFVSVDGWAPFIG